MVALGCCQLTCILLHYGVKTIPRADACPVSEINSGGKNLTIRNIILHLHFIFKELQVTEESS
jgi:hypothetical protein